MNKDKITDILRESISINEFKDAPTLSTSGEGSETEEKATESQYERVRSLLDNDKINHAGVIKQLWGSKDATKRSLFRKKLNKMNNDSGGKYEFSKDEISKIMSILTNFANEISSSLKPSKQTYKADK